MTADAVIPVMEDAVNIMINARKIDMTFDFIILYSSFYYLFAGGKLERLK